MFEIFIWVFSKGWKRVAKQRTAQGAYNTAFDFLPMEVKVTSPGRITSYYGGQCQAPIKAKDGKEIPEFNNLKRLLETA